MNRFNFNYFFKKSQRETLALTLLFFLCLTVNAQIIKVRGTVVNEKGEPVERVNVTNVADNLSVSTNEDGKYAITVSNAGKLKFTHMNYTAQTVNVKGRLKIDITMKTRSLMIEEVFVNGKQKKKKDPMVEPTDIEIHGNWAIVRTSISPNSNFNSHNRLLMQPYIYNETKKKRYYLKPLSLDGREYNITQTRMYDFDIKKDSLANFIVKKESERIPYVDSLYINNLNDLWRCDAIQSVENYRNILFGDTVVIANGIVNPLRFLKFDFAGSLLTDSSFFPMDEPQLRDDRDEMHLKFPIGKANLDLSDSTTVASLILLKKKLKDIESNQDAQLSAFEINGFASPEGNYGRNEELAAQRMNITLQEILSTLSANTRANLKSKKTSNVETWQHVADLMAKDSLISDANDIKYIIHKYSQNVNMQGKKIAKLPCFKKIASDYLPKLRKVDYQYSFKIYRSLSAMEIKDLYERNYKDLTKYEFFKLYRSEKDSVKSEAIARKALEVYPNFMVAACDLSAMCLQRGGADSKILEPFVGEKAPEQVNLNQIVNLLRESKYSKADSILDFIKDNQNTRQVKAYTEVMNHRFTDENFEIVAASGRLNEVVMLLAMKKNKSAYEKAKGLKEETAENVYIKALCANRLSKETSDMNLSATLCLSAIDLLKKAIKMDPTYLSLAEKDADLIDLLKDVIPQKGSLINQVK
jgi:hypothetical protein